MRVTRRLGAMLGAAVLAAAPAACLAGCGHDDPPAVHLTWRGERLPVHNGERTLVRGATWCGDRWVVVGATADARGDTRRAVWASSDGARWRRLRLDPRGDLYAAAAVLTSVGCRGDRMAVLGDKRGGAHSNPRVATWHQLADGSLAAVHAAFELYGGPNAVSVNQLSGGPKGYLITGTRAGGAAVWSSPTGDRFTLHENTPGLANTSAAQTQALDAVWWHGAWTVVGEAVVASARLAATAWTGQGGRPWRPTQLPGAGTLSTAERVTVTADGPVAAGLDGDAFGLWAERDAGWSLASTFGSQDSRGTSAAYVTGLGWTGHRLVTTYSDGMSFRLGVGTLDGVDDVPLPVDIGVAGDHTVTLATHGDDVLLLTDDGSQGRIWLTRVP